MYINQNERGALLCVSVVVVQSVVCRMNVGVGMAIRGNEI